MRRIATVLVALIVAALIAGEAVVWATAPAPVEDASIPEHVPDMANGEAMFFAGGCLSCHKPAEGSGIDASLPAGGHPLQSPAGVFYPPNITADRRTGIGSWSDVDFISAMMRGVSPQRQHYFPAFPYTSYRQMKLSDLLDLKAYLFSLKTVENEVPAHDIPLAYVARRLMGPWKWLAFGDAAVSQDPAKGEAWNRGAYLVQGPGHCVECHTPRNVAMITKSGAAIFLSGGPHPEGKGKVPSLRGLIARKRYKDADDLASALAFGETYGYEDISAGGMGAIQENISRLPETDVKAIAAFLVSIE